MSTGITEDVTPEEEAENNRFLSAILDTKVMKIAHDYLVNKKLVRPGFADFKKLLYRIWFQLYSRDGSRGGDSCGFEHVFVGEMKRGKEMMGFHNWVQFYLQERRNNIDYKGYVARQKKCGPDEDDQVLSLQFSWKSFIGVSPEFEFAVYTVVFLMSNEKVTRAVVREEEYELELVVYRHGKYIGASYPVLLSTSNEDLY
ncbi:poly(U)-specific endoribonuclease-like [Protopterus annectens]|uniref:poly(U)-specific endoribonuclease-like n=1 Tax=Protopterus annectens TaxID=7888 RepID=UPI001CF95BC6|nr:poly(U)-specific endoribonuclease-like [Protopterus annectens]